MRATGARSLALAVIDHGRVVYVKPYGVRTVTGAPLQADSIKVRRRAGARRPAFFRSRRELSRPQLAITTAGEFPTMQPAAPAAQRYRGLAVGTGVLTFTGPQGPGFQKGGHNDFTGNTMICLERPRRCVVMLGADVRAEAAFPALVRFILGDTGFPWRWLYDDMRFWDPAAAPGGRRGP